MMGREGGDPSKVSSSIALLQERFRQLQKVREKREEKQLLKLFTESERASSPSVCYEPNRLPFQPEVIGLNSHQLRQTNLRAMVIPESASLWPNSNNAATSSTSKNFENSVVDTSLHL